MTEISRNDGAYSRTTVFDNIVHEDDPLSQELRAVLDEFHWVPSLLSQTARVAVEMAEYGLDPATEQGQQTAARVLRARLTQTRQWVDGQADKLSRLADAEQKSAGTAVVYYIDLYGSAVKIGTSTNVLQRLRSLRRTEMHLLAVEPGSYKTERLRHGQFAAERIGNVEDFTRSDRLVTHIEAVRAAYGEPIDYLARTGRQSA